MSLSASVSGQSNLNQKASKEKKVYSRATHTIKDLPSKRGRRRELRQLRKTAHWALVQNVAAAQCRRFRLTKLTPSPYLPPSSIFPSSALEVLRDLRRPPRKRNPTREAAQNQIQVPEESFGPHPRCASSPRSEGLDRTGDLDPARTGVPKRSRGSLKGVGAGPSARARRRRRFGAVGCAVC